MLQWLADKLYGATGFELKLGDITFDEEAQLLVATILASAASSDREHAPDEAAEIIAILREEYGREASGAIDLLRDAVRRLADGDNVDELFGEIRRRLSLSEREKLMSHILRVVAADRHRAPDEWRFIRDAADRLSISHAAMDRAYQLYREFRGKSER